MAWSIKINFISRCRKDIISFRYTIKSQYMFYVNIKKNCEDLEIFIFINWSNNKTAQVHVQ